MIDHKSTTPDLLMTLSRRCDCAHTDRIELTKAENALTRSGRLVAEFVCSRCRTVRTLTVKLDGDAVFIEWRNTAL